jgi:hypothetical protein
MLVTIFMVVQTAITPAQSIAADAVAVRHFTETCSDGAERVGIVTAADGVFHDISQQPMRHTVALDEASFKSLCPRQPLISYHCHTTDDSMSLFPGLGLDGRSSDFGLAAYMEYLCAQEGISNPVIDHRIVHTGGTGSVVRFGIRGTVLQRARALGRRMADAIPPVGASVDRRGVPSFTAMTQAPKEMQSIYEELVELYEGVYRSYREQVYAFLKRSCPAATADDELIMCPVVDTASFVRTMEPCHDIFITLGDVQTPSCAPVTGQRIVLSARYAGWPELTAESYQAVASAPHAVVAFCSGSGRDSARSCDVFLPELDAQLPSCSSLRRGYVDVDINPQLRLRHNAAWQDVVLLESGRRYTINLSHPNPHLFKLIVCGPESLFSGFAF